MTIFEAVFVQFKFQHVRYSFSVSSTYIHIVVSYIRKDFEMPKRYLTIRNETNEHKQPQSSKRVNNDESNPVKKMKVAENHTEKENIPKTPAHQSTNTTEATPEVQIVEPIPEENVDLTIEESSDEDTDLDDVDNDLDDHDSDLSNDDTDLSDDDDDDDIVFSSDESDDDDDDDSAGKNAVISIAPDDKGKEYPANKQYVIYENAGLEKQPLIVSKTARFWSLKYRKVLRRVYPDAYGMYIYADFSCYGHLEVVENCLNDLTKAIFVVQERVANRISYKLKPNNKINHILAFRRLEALTILLDHADGISGIDDGDRFYEIMRVIGACYVTILRGFLPNEMFTKFETFDEGLVEKLNKISKQLPNFKQVLEHAIIVGYLFLTIADVCSAYTNVLQVIYCNWVLVMDKVTIDWNKKTTNNNLWKALKHAAQIDRNNIDYGDKESFDYLKELRLYKGRHGLGGEAFDLKGTITPFSTVISSFDH
ncbi:unnamed protein product [Rotaria magnacalcarata]